MSVDLVGSTAYKAGKGSEVISTTARQKWVDETRHFYREFPRMLGRRYGDAPIAGGEAEGLCPSVWKTVGDEIIFCIRLEHLQHLGRCIWSFIGTLEEYSRYLEDSKIELDVKGVAWSAAFPSPNVTVLAALKHSESSSESGDLQDQESIEMQADKDPSKFEFLGKEIDAGFRVAKHSSADRFALSLEVSYLIADLCSSGDYNFPLTYAGREGLKGVIGSRPYPIVAIDTERRSHRREVRAFEQAITGNQDAKPHLLKTFLEALMKDEKVEFPFLARKGEELAEDNLPPTYKYFSRSWSDSARESLQRTKVEEQAELEDDVTKSDLNSEEPSPDPESIAAIRQNAEELMKRFKEPG